MRFFALLWAVMVMLAVSPAHAQQVQMATCWPGGCSCALSDVTLADLEVMLGKPNPPGADQMTLVVEDTGFSWRSQTPEQIDRSFGGPGSCPVYLAGPMLPEDGIWRMSAGATDSSACPLLQGQAIPAQLSGETRQIDWNGGFHPDSLLVEARGMVRWSRTGDRSWRGVVVDESLADGSGSTSGSVIWRMALVSPTEITGTSVFEYTIASSQADAQVQALLGSLNCRTVTPFRANRID
ncbi:hypothetical protein [Pelagibacterium montanilacus]|uniref:hypothetical protein n=1 Tax=Pelagibacterium montanilacus TaxID=2185280 RepID=UPI000F8CCD4A|nr:hypothetical protein [Pelagibacterium montanilacus]